MKCGNQRKVGVRPWLVVALAGTLPLGLRAGDAHAIPGDFASICEALASEDVRDGDTLRLGAGTHAFARETDATTGYTCLGAVRKGVRIEGASDPAQVVLDCGGQGGLVLDHADAVVCGVTFKNFVNDSAVSALALKVTQGLASNVVVNGAGSCSASIAAVSVGSGGTLACSEILAITNGAWGGTHVSVAGGVLRRVKVSRCSNNSHTVEGSASGGRRARFEDCVFSDSYGYYGGALYSYAADVIRCSFVGNDSHDALALRVAPGKTVCVDCAFTNNVCKKGNVAANVIHAPEWNTEIVLTNCLIAGNRSYTGGVFSLAKAPLPVSLVNCTIAGNVSQYGSRAGFVDGGTASYQPTVTLRNTILRGNLANGVDAEGLDLACVKFTFDHCCYTDAAAESGCFDADPLFTASESGDYTLRSGSPCVDTGLTVPALTNDVAGVLRPQDGDGDGVAAHDVGCYERPESSIPLEVTLSVLGDEGVSPCAVTQLVSVTGKRKTGLSYRWQAIRNAGGVVTTNVQQTATATNVFENLLPGRYLFGCTVTNDATPPDSASDAADDVFVVYADTTYVSPDGAGAFPYDTPAKATGDLVLAYTNAGRRVVLAPGHYAFGHTTDSTLACDCQLAVRRGVAIVGADDPAEVLLDCQGLGGLVLDHAEASVSGVTISNFLAVAGSGPVLYVASGLASNIVVNGARQTTQKGEGVYVGPRAVAEGVVVTNLHFVTWGGSPLAFNVKGGTLRRCAALGGSGYASTVAVNPDDFGRRSRLEDCRIIGNNQYYNAGAYLNRADVFRCAFCGNTSSKDGVAGVNILGATLTACVIAGNSGPEAVYSGPVWGDERWSQMTNCLVAGNACTTVGAILVGGANGALELVNCTVTDNASSSGAAGGLTFKASDTSYPGRFRMVNAIVYGNAIGAGAADVQVDPANFKVFAVSNSCFAEAASYPDAANFAKDPGFVRPAAGDYRLRRSSPCCGAGQNGGWTRSDVDLAGLPRWMFRRVDVGCYECQQRRGGMQVLLR